MTVWIFVTFATIQQLRFPLSFRAVCSIAKRVKLFYEHYGLASISCQIELIHMNLRAKEEIVMNLPLYSCGFCYWCWLGHETQTSMSWKFQMHDARTHARSRKCEDMPLKKSALILFRTLFLVSFRFVLASNALWPFRYDINSIHNPMRLENVLMLSRSVFFSRFYLDFNCVLSVSTKFAFV